MFITEMELKIFFYDNEKVLYISTHQFPYYPGTGTEKEKGKYNNIFNIPLTCRH